MEWSAVIVDEAHRIKNPKARVTEVMKALKCNVRIGLTGTILQNNMKELWCVMDWWVKTLFIFLKIILHIFNLMLSCLLIISFWGEKHIFFCLLTEVFDFKHSIQNRKSHENLSLYVLLLVHEVNIWTILPILSSFHNFLLELS